MFRTFAVLLFTLNLAACSLFTTRDDVPLRQATLEQLTNLLAERQAAVHSMKGLFSAKLTGGILPIGQRVEGTMFYQRPDAIRLRGFTAFGGELFEFVQADDAYRLRLPTMGREFNGRRSEPEKMGKLARAFQLSVWAMSGVIGTTAIAPSERPLLVEDGDRYRLDVYATDGDRAAVASTPIRRIWFDRRLLVVVREERLSPAGDVEAIMQFEDFRPVGEPSADTVAHGPGAAGQDDRLLRPFRISMKDGQGQGTVQLTFHEIIPNASFQPGELGRV
ncbi:MAG TPA: hypothetical protein VHF07_01625 [Nitrospiraceae bacterium]|nr:hypothetical protein [Nitrospiraceae bacterium]